MTYRHSEQIDVAAIRTELAERNQLPERYHIDFGPEERLSIEIYNRLEPKIVRTCYWDESAMRDMGIGEEIQALLTRLKMWDFFSRRLPTYKCLTLEFLSTLRVRRAENSAYPLSIQYRLGNQAFTTYTHALNGIFETPRGRHGVCFGQNKNFMPNVFWQAITSTPTMRTEIYNSSNARPTCLRNPVLRYLDKILLHHLLSHSEGESVTQNELYILWCIVNKVTFDVAAIFIEQCEKMQYHNMANIEIGGIITQIALFHGIDMENRVIVTSPQNELDMNTMVRMEVVEMIGTTWCLKQNGGASFPLPNPELTSVFGRRVNLTLTGEAHYAAIRNFVPANGAATEQAEAAQQVEGSAGPQMEEVPVMRWQLNEYEWNRMLSEVAALKTRCGALEDRMESLEAQKGRMWSRIRGVLERMWCFGRSDGVFGSTNGSDVAPDTRSAGTD